MAMPTPVDFWYAVNNTRIPLMPMRRLETFGTTVLNYHMLSELMDTAGQVRIREGRILAGRPEIIMPSAYASTLLEGFGEAAQQYADWLREHAAELRILRYGFKIRKEEHQQHVLTENLTAVAERVERDVRATNDPLAAVVVGVDEPWEVCLIKLMADVLAQSMPGNVRELERRGLFSESDSTSSDLRAEIERDFERAAQDPGRVRPLGEKLQKYGLFKEYEDRFFALFKR